MKRFTETTKWHDPWFRKLAWYNKLLWQYMLDHCDNAGMWPVDLELAGMFIGYTYSMDTVLEDFGDRIRVYKPSEKWWIRKFVEYQYARLSEGCKPHKQVIDLLTNYGLLKEYQKGIHTLQDKDKDKDTSKNKNKTMATPGFNAFYAIYPRKVAKAEAVKAWGQMECEPLTQQIVKAITWQKDIFLQRDPEKRPHPATWLRDKRWEDEEPEATMTQTGNKPPPTTRHQLNLQLQALESLWEQHKSKDTWRGKEAQEVKDKMREVNRQLAFAE